MNARFAPKTSGIGKNREKGALTHLRRSIDVRFESALLSAKELRLVRGDGREEP
jgi:hypothetical protein